MREIKFRKWYLGEMDYSPGIWADGEGQVLVNHYFESEDEGRWMQYTGLKDKYGIEIYEGDILKFEDCGEEGYEYKDGFDFKNLASVCFTDGRFELENFWSDNSAVLDEMSSNDHETFIGNFGLSEIIGNIYQHSHFLKQKDPS